MHADPRTILNGPDATERNEPWPIDEMRRSPGYAGVPSIRFGTKRRVWSMAAGPNHGPAVERLAVAPRRRDA